MLNLKSIESQEWERANEISKELIEKPKPSILMFIFPFVLMPFIQEMRAYKLKRELFLKEYMYIKNIVFEELKNGWDYINIEKNIRIKISKNNVHEELYKCQYEEAICTLQFFLERVKEKEMRKKEIFTLEKTIEILNLKDEALELSLKLKKILELKSK
ncbi:hypothetical protein H5J22_05210 [Cetobacterium sp. 8H]|uniref:hypothetical protein n=1 Tax=Cetobacterium sp. 8H TaxID=2759681 RepID=UPI00163CC546|nr:hypothetical protein [Cetobacterium sp. 8H]MBC2850833.1 hypothetical protein [Cetobacterium sp. 8H]